MSYNAHIFYYAWYGTPRFNGKWYHWNHDYLPNWDKSDKRILPTGSHNPEEDDIGSNFFPKLGAYSSSDPKVVDEHMKMISDSHIGVVVVSWYPPYLSDPNGPQVDQLIPILLDAASKKNLRITFHIEPYVGRNATNMIENVKYIIDSYGSHPAFYKMRMKDGKELPLFYIYDSYLTSNKDWQKLLILKNTNYESLFIGLLVDYKHQFDIKESGFDGFYTVKMLGEL